MAIGEIDNHGMWMMQLEEEVEENRIYIFGTKDIDL